MKPKFEIFNLQALKKLETPCFIYDLKKIGKKIDSIKSAFKDTLYSQYYPVKSNPNIDMVRYCTGHGLGIDACSMGDLEIARILNVPPADISFTGVGLNEQDMHYIYKNEIIPNLGSIEEIKRWAKMFPGSRIGLRVSTIEPGFDINKGYSLKMGVFPGDWPVIKHFVQQYKLGIVRLHRHESNNLISYTDHLYAYSSTFERVPGWVWKNVKKINFGGGWGLPYLRDRKLDVDKLVEGIVNLTQNLKIRNNLESLEIEIEPGEFIVGECGYLLSKVLDVRTLSAEQGIEDIQIVILDAPFPITSGFRSPELLSAVECLPADSSSKKKVFTKVYGRSNTSMDTINKGSYRPEVNIGDLALIYWVGAYVPVLLSHFNEQDIPAEFILKDDFLMMSRDRIRFNVHYNNYYLKGVEHE